MGSGDRFLVPEGCDLIAAAALPVAFGTSHVALVHRAQLKPGQVCLSLNIFLSFYQFNLTSGT